MKTVAELFEHELEDIYYAERKLVDALGTMVEESTDTNVRQAFADHRTQTQGHLTRLDNVFAAIGHKPAATKCDGIEGLIKEKKEFSKEDPTPDILDIYNLGAGAKSERYEISAYQGLIGMAQELGLSDAQQLLRQNLAEEEQALAMVTSLTKTVLHRGAVAAGR